MRLFRRGPLSFWWGLLLTTAILAITVGVVVSPAGFGAVLAAVVTSVASARRRRSRVARKRIHSGARRGNRRSARSVRSRLLSRNVAARMERTARRANGRRSRSPRSICRIPARPARFKSARSRTAAVTTRIARSSASKVDIVSEPVDGSKLIEGWSGLAGWARTQYWGFDAKQLPRQGRVWFPDGDGPFPLVLMVHGNHDMEDFSDPGYAYLGELFASRGIIAVSVDENFLNSSNADLLGGFKGGLKKENDARGWMLLEHLRLWRQWNQDPASRFHGKVDLDRIALIGHSRGGEAVAIAALFNRLPFYPDDGRVAFDYGFNLRGVIAIAPSDEQYEPRSVPTKFDDVSYLVIQGSNDGDVQSYMGSAQYSRVGFDKCDRCFKAGFYLLDANHGQFNTAWGRNDLSSVCGDAC